MEKKFFEEPSVQKVEFEFKERIAASACLAASALRFDGNSNCLDS